MKGMHYLLCLLLLSPLGVSAGSPDIDEVRAKPKWQALDANGRVALHELHPIPAQAMKGNDLDGDGIITLVEYLSFDRDPGGAGGTTLASNVRLIANLPYAATDDPRQRLDVYLPKQPAVQGGLPVIAYIHGGGWFMGSPIMARPTVISHVDSGRYAAI